MKYIFLLPVILLHVTAQSNSDEIDPRILAGIPIELDWTKFGYPPEVELKGDYLIKKSSDAYSIAENEYVKCAGEGFTSRQGLKYGGLVTLPFDVAEFSKKGEKLYLFIAHNVLTSTPIAKAWVNPRNGKCVYFDAPWLIKAAE
jgi:hypothetical protein